MSKLTFEDVLKDAERKYRSKIPIYGESWKSAGLVFLKERLNKEITELDAALYDFENFTGSRTRKKAYFEAIDVINLACMLAKRLKPEQTRKASGAKK